VCATGVYIRAVYGEATYLGYTGRHIYPGWVPLLHTQVVYTPVLTPQGGIYGRFSPVSHPRRGIYGRFSPVLHPSGRHIRRGSPVLHSSGRLDREVFTCFTPLREAYGRYIPLFHASPGGLYLSFMPLRVGYSLLGPLLRWVIPSWDPS